ncbi:hypothetical protein BLNAU_8701 [Blattamonas nauphoetae]|uniref:Uncharacterized protein n=1 Tax=Blattamonas nauphoetae TaxID=2049346 RepID=A0ABQ9XXY7_9EUKA|nr:hypothetical protein BLNAU_8701 [Blattamonas nauphoetae]
MGCVPTPTILQPPTICFMIIPPVACPLIHLSRSCNRSHKQPSEIEEYQQLQTTLLVIMGFALHGPSSETEQLVTQHVSAVREGVLFSKRNGGSTDLANTDLMLILENSQVG